MKRGEVYWAVLFPRSGSEQQGERPVIVVSRDAFNSVPGWRSVNIVPVSTSERQASRRATAVPLPRGAGGLVSESVALCHRITTLDRSKLVRRMGALPEDILIEVGEALNRPLT